MAENELSHELCKAIEKQVVRTIKRELRLALEDVVSPVLESLRYKHAIAHKDAKLIAMTVLDELKERMSDAQKRKEELAEDTKVCLETVQEYMDGY